MADPGDELLLGVDVGTGSTKAVAATPDGRVLATASIAHGVERPRPGWAEMDAEATWWPEVVGVVRELVDRVGSARVNGIGVSGMGPCVLLVDADDRPVRRGILYGVDTRAGRQIEEQTRRLGADAVLERCGRRLSAQSVGPKLQWVRDEEPETWARARRWHGLHTWVVARLTGEYVIDHQSASQSDPLYDVRALGWAADWAAPVTEPLQMPRLAWPHEVVGGLTRAAAHETGLREGLPVVAGTIDAWAESVSAGVRRPGDVMLMYGSTMFVLTPLDELVVRPPLWTTAGVEPGSRTLATGMATSGSLVRWVHELVGEEVGALDDEAAELPPGADGLVVLPYFAGERAPIEDHRARGVAIGLTLRHGPAHLVRATYEGVALGTLGILEQLIDGTGVTAPRLVAVGGGTRSRLLTQLVSDATGQLQTVPQQTIGASHGSALLAAVGTGLVPPGADWARPDRVIEPDLAVGERYAELAGLGRALYLDTSRHMHALTAIAERDHTR